MLLPTRRKIEEKKREHVFLERAAQLGDLILGSQDPKPWQCPFTLLITPFWHKAVTMCGMHLGYNICHGYQSNCTTGPIMSTSLGRKTQNCPLVWSVEVFSTFWLWGTSETLSVSFPAGILAGKWKIYLLLTDRLLNSTRGLKGKRQAKSTQIVCFGRWMELNPPNWSQVVFFRGQYRGRPCLISLLIIWTRGLSRFADNTELRGRPNREIWMSWINGLRPIVSGLKRPSARSCTLVTTTPCIAAGLGHRGWKTA